MTGHAAILDMCCGSRMFWFDKNDDRAIFSDIRKEEHTLCDGRRLIISPDLIADFRALPLKWSTKTGHRVRVFSSIDFPIRLVVTHHYIRAVLVRCNIQRYSPLLRELHR